MKQSQKEFDLLSDKELVSAIINGNALVTNYFFYTKCRRMLEYIVYRVFGNKMEYDELVSELYIFLQSGDWHKLRQFDYRSKLTTWFQVVSIRFSVKMRCASQSHSGEELNERSGGTYEQEKLFMLDFNRALSMIRNDKYREVLIMLIMLDKEPKEVASHMGITIDNLYNIKSRAIKQLVRHLL